jgi:hypothetical protein
MFVLPKLLSHLAGISPVILKVDEENKKKYTKALIKVWCEGDVESYSMPGGLFT